MLRYRWRHLIWAAKTGPPRARHNVFPLLPLPPLGLSTCLKKWYEIVESVMTFSIR